MCTVQAPSHLGSRTMAVAAADEEAVYPPSKRIRSSSEKTGASTRAGTPPKSLDSQRLFAPFRALGIITNNVPFALQLRAVKGSAEGPRVHILTCLGNSWALWEGEKMTLLFVGELAPPFPTSSWYSIVKRFYRIRDARSDYGH